MGDPDMQAAQVIQGAEKMAKRFCNMHLNLSRLRMLTFMLIVLCTVTLTVASSLTYHLRMHAWFCGTPDVLATLSTS